MKFQTQQGFTLVETLVAILVLTLSITGPLFIAQQSFISAATSRDRTTASFLAQEGVEYIRSVRDHNYLSSDDWLTGLNQCLSGTCAIDAVNDPFPNIRLCSGGTCDPLLRTTQGLFQYGSGVESRFTRAITIRAQTEGGTPKDNEVIVTSEVFWDYKGVTRSVKVVERLFDWL